MAAMLPKIEIGDVVRLRKQHPCGSYEWEVVRIGVDIGLVCRGCQRRIMLARPIFHKRLKAIVPPPAEP
jgi:hypothetical protein